MGLDHFSFAHLEKTHPVAAELLSVSVLLAPENIPEELFTQDASAPGVISPEIALHPSVLDQAIKVLLTYRLIERQASAHTFRVSALVQSTLRDRLSLDEQQRYIEKILRALHHTITSSADAAQTRNLLFVPHIQMIATLSQTWILAFPEMAEVFSWAAKILYEQENYDEAERLLRAALAIYKRLHGSAHITVATTLYNLANLQRARGNYAEAEELLIRTNLVRVRVLGPEHLDTMLCLSDLGDVYAAQRKREEAETIYQRVLTNSERALGSEHALTTKVHDNLAALYVEWANAAEMGTDTEELHGVKAAIGEEEEEKDEPINDQAHNSLALLYAEWANIAKWGADVEEVHGTELAGEEDAEPPHLKAARVLHKLALLYVGEKKWEQAAASYQRVLPVYDSILGSTNADTLQCLHELTFLYLQQGNFKDAEATLEQVLKVSEQAVGPKHPDVAAELNSLAALYIEQGKFEQAEQMLQRAFTIGADLPGAHPVVVMSLSNLAAVYMGQGKPQQATPLLRSMLVILEQALGAEHPKVAAVREQYQQLLKSLQQ